MERNQRIGKLLRERRNKLGLSAEAVAGLAGLTGSYVTRLELGQTGHSTDTLSKIAGVLQLSLDQIYAAVSTSNVAPAAIDYRRVPILDYVQAGNWRLIEPQMGELGAEETVLIDANHPPSTFGLWVRGDSMLPDFREGDLVFFSSAIQPRPGDFVIANDAAGESTFKQYRALGINEHGREVFELHPLNPVYPTMRSDRQEIAIVATLIEHRRFRRRMER